MKTPLPMLNPTFMWMAFMMRAAHTMNEDGYDPRLLFLYKLYDDPKDFYAMIEKHRKSNSD